MLLFFLMNYCFFLGVSVNRETGPEHPGTPRNTPGTLQDTPEYTGTIPRRAGNPGTTSVTIK